MLQIVIWSIILSMGSTNYGTIRVKYTCELLVFIPHLFALCVRYALSLSIIIMVGMALGVGFGISGFLNYPLTQVSFMAVFILFGIGKALHTRERCTVQQCTLCLFFCVAEKIDSGGSARIYFTFLESGHKTRM